MLFQLVSGSGKGQNLYVIFFEYRRKSIVPGRPNQAQVAPGIAFHDAQRYGQNHIRIVSGHPSDLTLLAPVRRTGSPGIFLLFEKCIHMKYLFSFQDRVGSSG